MLTVAEVIQKSSNVGTVKLAMQMSPREMWETYAQAGFGQKPQLPFPGAVSGRLRPYKTWRPIEQATMSYGYGLSASLFQLAQAYTIFARDGELIPMTLLKSRRPPRRARVRRANAVAVRKMLEMATGPGGTAQGADRSAIRWAARPARRTSRKARATPATSTAAGSWAWRPSSSRASSWR